MNFEATRKWIKTATKPQMDELYDAAMKKWNSSRSPNVKMGAAMILDELACEVERRKNPTPEFNGTIDELMAELQS